MTKKQTAKVKKSIIKEVGNTHRKELQCGGCRAKRATSQIGGTTRGESGTKNDKKKSRPNLKQTSAPRPRTQF